MSGTDAWSVRRSRLPGLIAAWLLTTTGVYGLVAGDGWLWWGSAVGAIIGTLGFVATLHRDTETLRLHLGEQVRLQSGDGSLTAEGRLDGDSVVSPWLIALRIRGKGAQRPADLILDPWSAPAEELRRLRVRLLGDETLRA